MGLYISSHLMVQCSSLYRLNKFYLNYLIMKNQINNHLLVIFLTLIQGCTSENFQEELGGNICQSCQTTENYNKVRGIIREIAIGDNQSGGSYSFFYHKQYANDQPFKLYVITTKENDLLVPCEILSDDFKLDSLAVIFSGSKTDCCNVLTHTNWRASFGCMTAITSIETISDN